MFENINNLTLSGGVFGNGTTLNGIFRKRINILYGPNGTGKSTISRALADIKNDGCEPSGPSIVGWNDEQKEELKDKIYVFNEDFVDRKIKLEDDGVGSIVMLGENIENDDKIKKLNEEIEKLKSENKDLSAELDGDDFKEGMVAEALNISNSLESKLKGDDNWAGRLKRIKGNKNKPALNMNEIFGAKDNPNNLDTRLSVIQQKMTENITKIESSKDATHIDWNIPAIPSDINIGAINDLMSTVVSKVDDADEFVTKLAETSMHTIMEAKRSIVEKILERCPYCQQVISPDWMETLKRNIKAVMNEEADGLCEKIDVELMRTRGIEISFDELSEALFSNEINAVRTALSDYNKFIGKMATRLEEKKKNLYTKMEGFDNTEFGRLRFKLDETLSKLSEKVNEQNTVINDRKRTQDDSIAMNNWLAYLDHKNEIDKLLALRKGIETKRTEIGGKAEEIKGYEQAIQGLSLATKNMADAVKMINYFIATAFFDEDRLKLEASDRDGKYQLVTRGQRVKPRQVSIGERNILAISYFFATLFENTSASNRYDIDRLIVIDDPISSFDKGSRAGMLSIFRVMMNKLLKNGNDVINTHCKILIMSHDRQTVTDFKAIASELDRNDCINIRELKVTEGRSEIYDFYDRGSDYMICMRNLLDFALSDSPTDVKFYGIGNQLRQALETYAKLNFNNDCSYVLNNNHIWKMFNIDHDKNDDDELFQRRKKKLKEGVKANLNKVIMNEQSHATAITDLTAYESSYSLEELQKVTKCFLAFVDSVTRQHSFGFIRSQNKAAELDNNNNRMSKLVYDLSISFTNQNNQQS